MRQVQNAGVALHGKTAALFPWLLTAFVFASRLPYLRPGYGTDPDAFRVIAAARCLRAGEYTASRLPGYPLHEAITALLLPGGPRLVNGATALMSALAALGLFRLAETLGLDRARAALLALSFAFTPVVFQSSTSSIDYMWSICFVLWSANELARGRAWRAGLLLGAAIGARLTAGAMLVPLLTLNACVSAPALRLKRALRLCLSAGLIAGVCFAPVLHTYGFDFFNYDDSAMISWQTAATRASVEVWGSLGVYAWCGVFAIALCAARPIKRAWERANARSVVITSCSALVVFAGAFLMLPHEAGYLIPCVPFLLLLVAFLLPTVAIAELACLLTLSCFVALDADGLSLDGPMPAAHARRTELNSTVSRVVRRMSHTSGKALVISGLLMPLIEVKLGGNEQGAHRYIYFLQSEAELLGYAREGYTLYYVDRGVERRQRRLFGIALRAHGARSVL